MSNPGEQIEQAEQAQEAMADPFNRRVTLSIAITAAFLATVGMFGQNADNEAILTQGEALRIQGDALRQQTLAVLRSNEATNMWSLYQANNIRSHLYKAFADNAATVDEPTKKAASQIVKWLDKHGDYEEKRLPVIKEKAEKLIEKSNEAMVAAAEALVESNAKLKESTAAQAKADRFDYGELGLQLGVVLCSLAILMHNRNFWFAGIACSLLGLLIGLTGIFELFMDVD